MKLLVISQYLICCLTLHLHLAQSSVSVTDLEDAGIATGRGPASRHHLSVVWVVLLGDQREPLYPQSQLDISQVSVHPGLVLEVVDRLERIDAGNSAVLKAK